MRAPLVSALSAALCLACSAVEIEVAPPPVALVVNSIGETMPPDVQPAHIYEIDGEPVPYQRRSYILEPGRHLVRVWPEGPAQRMVPDVAAIEEEKIQVDAIELDVEAGHRYLLGARVTRTRTLVSVATVDGVKEEYGDWEKTVEPVLVKDVPPPTVEQAVKSFSGFFGSLLLGPLMGGAG